MKIVFPAEPKISLSADKQSIIFPYLDELAMVYNQVDFSQPESFVILAKKPFNLPPNVSRLKFDILVVISIGGSNLGLRAIYGTLKTVRFFKKEVIFLDDIKNETPFIFSRLKRSMKSGKKILINLISKSGKTLETLGNFEALQSYLGKDFKKIKVLAVTDRNSYLWKKAEEYKWPVFEIPSVVGGRYSVFSAVGLLPMKLLGLDIEIFLSGVKKAAEYGFTKDPEKNLILKSALWHFRELTNKNTLVHFYFDAGLEDLGLWWQQIIAESLSKEGKGLTPLVSRPKDLHSMLQLYLAGPKDKIFNFILSPHCACAIKKPILNQGLVGRTLEDVASAIYKSVRGSFEKTKIPFLEVVLENLDEKELGEYMMFRILEMLFLAKLLEINPFGEPDIEEYKRRALKKLGVSF